VNTPTPQPSSLPPSSPPPPFTSDDESDNGVVDELEQIQDIDLGGSNPDHAEEDEEGEDLFGDDMMEDYVGNARLDQYDVADINDDPDVPNLDPETRAWPKLRWPDVTDGMPEVMAREGVKAGHGSQPFCNRIVTWEKSRKTF